MELRVLQYFLAVAREQSISGAAELPGPYNQSTAAGLSGYSSSYRQRRR